MPVITWTEEQYGTGVGFADDQHKRLFDLLNDLHDAAPSGEKAAIGAKLDALIAYVVEHFQAEEKAMQEKKYGGYAAHKVEHDKLVATCADLQKKFHAGEAQVNQETTAFVKSWLDDHIPKVDRAYEPTLNS